MTKILVITSLVLSFVLTSALVSNSFNNHMTFAQDLSNIKDKATNLLTGSDNSQTTNNNSSSSSTTTNSSASSDSSLTQKATDAMGQFLK